MTKQQPNSIVITGVEHYEVPPGEPVYFYKGDPRAHNITEDQYIRSEAIDREAVKPFYVKRYPAVDIRKPMPGPTVIPDPPEEYYIYASWEVQDKLGLVYDAWNDMVVRINQDYDTIMKQKDQIDHLLKVVDSVRNWKEYYQTGNIFMRILKVIMR